ncbi:MAG: hypothetical protein IJX13_03455 [Clostridia bacterium]|nr:hypothetical protein [Clostridia bacterium]
MMIRSTGENAYFAASNSVSGFLSYYAEIFNAARIKHVYAVKGGPGTGKSRFLRDVAEYAERLGWSGEYIYCSSDPLSLDAVILSRRDENCIALLDATAPHVYEPTCPGAREDMINLGAFWNAGLLSAQIQEIEQLNTEKSNAYRRSYRFLAGLGQMSRNRDMLVAPYIRREKIQRFAEKILQNVPRGREYFCRPALIHSIGMRGEVGFDTYFADARKLYIVEDCRGAAQYLMAELGNMAQELRQPIRVSHDPIEPEKIDGLFFASLGLAVAVCRDEECDYSRKKINMRRFVDTAAMKGVRSELNYTERMIRAMKNGAMDALEKVREIHFRLEEIYSSAMDFEAKENFTKRFCEETFGLQKE